MDIEIKKIVLTVDQNEARKIANALMFMICNKEELKHHWSRFGVERWKASGKEQKDMAFLIYRHLGREDLYEAVILEAERNLERYIKEREDREKEQPK